jgi:transcriptional regulator with XRE-family HTH domain
MKVRELGEFIRTQRRATGVSLRKLATLTGVSNPYLSQIERGLRRPSADMLQAIAKGLRVSAQTLYVKAGILEEEAGADVRAAVMGDPGLTQRQKQALVAVYESFREETERRRLTVSTGKDAAEPAEDPLTTAAKTVVRGAAKRGRTRSTAGGRTETQAVSQPSPGSPSSSRSPSRRKAAPSRTGTARASGARKPVRTRSTPKGGATTP